MACIIQMGSWGQRGCGLSRSHRGSGSYLGRSTPGSGLLFQASSISTATFLWLAQHRTAPPPRPKLKRKSFQVLVFKSKNKSRVAKSLTLQKRCIHVAEASLPEVRCLQPWLFPREGNLSGKVGRYVHSVQRQWLQNLEM